jgi:hypothetical protein
LPLEGANLEQRRIQADRLKAFGLKENPFYNPIKAAQAGNNKQGNYGLEIADSLVFLTVFSLQSKQPAHRYHGIANYL